MAWTKRDQIIGDQLQEWIQTLNQDNSNDFKDTYVKWLEHGYSLIPDKIKTPFFEKLDTWLFHLHSLIQSMQIQEDTRNRILSTARVFDDKVQTISDMRNLTIDQLSYIADQHSARHRLYSFIQGGVTGTGKSMILSTDFLVMIILNMRAVQIIAVSYGYDIKTPFEMMTSLKVFHAASLPKRLKGKAWELLLNDLEEQQYFYEGIDQVTSYQWLEEPFKQVAKAYLISLFQKEKDSKLSLIPLAIGAGANYQFSRKVTDFADKYYKFRYLYDKGWEL
ncbi:EcsC family protein [Heyndrickxia vini]|uniref:EcsC family protein n=1 Tax=Heyndrickxia vini TaxID=1476025 RepID=A0ABX7E8D4_9BACI|nr:EcsC family protein [Heyndrickxia vini]QQZ10612.1 EcsC family protein [Heyndrickxia vini]